MKQKKLFCSFILVMLVITIALVGGSLYMLDYSLRPSNPGKDLNSSMRRMRDLHPQLVHWLDSLENNNALRDTFITAPDGIRLHAFYVRASQATPNTAVLIHGYTGNAIRMLHIGYLYNHELDYNILLPDLRYSGLSEGDAIQMGWLDRKDVIQWIETIPALFGDSIAGVIHGISMGAATTMMVAGETLPKYIHCFVEDCGYTSVWDQFRKELKVQFGLPDFPLLYIASWLCQWQNGWNFKEASALDQVAKCKLPMLFIHGDKDDYVPTWMVEKVFESKPAPKELWIVPGADHSTSYQYYPQEYTQKVKAFMELYNH